MQIFIFTLIGLLCMTLLVYLFVQLGRNEKDSDPRRVEELWVRAHGDAAMVKMYYKAHSDEERAQIISFIHSACPQEPGPNGTAPLSPATIANTPDQEDAAEGESMYFGGSAPATEQMEAKNYDLSDKLKDQLFGGLNEETEEAPLSKKELRALKKKEKAAAKAAAKQAALIAASDIQEGAPQADPLTSQQDAQQADPSALQQDANSLEQAPDSAPAETDAWLQDDLEMNIRARLDEIAQKAQAELAAVGKPASSAQEEKQEEKPEEKSPAEEELPGPVCPTCGVENPPDRQSCIICGQPLNQEQATERTSSFPFDELAAFFNEPGTMKPLDTEQINGDKPQSRGSTLVEPSDEPTEEILRPFVSSGEPLTQEEQAEIAPSLAMSAEQEALPAQTDGEPLPQALPDSEEAKAITLTPEQPTNTESTAATKQQITPEPIASVEENTAAEEASAEEKQIAPRQTKTVEEILSGLTAELTMELQQEELQLQLQAAAAEKASGKASAEEATAPAEQAAEAEVISPLSAYSDSPLFEDTIYTAYQTLDTTSSLSDYSTPPHLEDTIYTEFQSPDFFALNAELLCLEFTDVKAADPASPAQHDTEEQQTLAHELPSQLEVPTAPASPAQHDTEEQQTLARELPSQLEVPAAPASPAQHDTEEQQTLAHELPSQLEVPAAPAEPTPTAQHDTEEQQTLARELPSQKTAAMEQATAVESKATPAPAATAAMPEQESSPLSSFSSPPQLGDTIYGEFQMFSNAYSSADATINEDLAQLQAQVSQQNKVIIEEALAQSKEAAQAKADPKDKLHMMLNPLEYTIEDDLSASVAALSAELKGVQDVFDRWQEQKSEREEEEEEEPTGNEQEELLAESEISATPEAEPETKESSHLKTVKAKNAPLTPPISAEEIVNELMREAANNVEDIIKEEAERKAGKGGDSLLAATQRVLNKGKSSGRTVSDQLGLPEALSLEDILHNVRELEKRISEESGYHDEE